MTAKSTREPTLKDQAFPQLHDEQKEPAQVQTLPEGLRVFMQILVIMAGICLLLECVSHFVLHLGYPYDWPLMFRHPSFFDFEAYFDQFHRLHTPSFFEGQYLMMYPAPVVVCYWIFYSFQPHATTVFVSFIGLTSLVATSLVTRALICRGLAPRLAIGLMVVTYLLSYPLWFETKQANTEIIVWLIVTLGIYLFTKGRNTASAALFGIAGALKFYPIIYLGLLLTKRRYRDCILGCVLAAFTLLVSLWLLGPTIQIAWHGTQAGLAQSQRDYLLTRRPNEVGFDHSLFGLLKAIVVFANRISFRYVGLVAHLSPRLLSLYLAVVAILGGLLYFGRIQRLPVANQVLCLSIASILLPPLSFDYTLMHLYVPWTLLAILAVTAQQRGVRVPGLRLAFAVLALSVCPLSELIFHHERFGGEIRSVILLTLFAIGLRFRFDLPERISDRRSSFTAGSPAVTN